MTHKSARVAEMVAGLQGRELDARYLGYFECFNQELFYEAHEVLEDLWLLDRKGQDGDFYKGLIQLAGAFVHLQKDRLQPCIALLGLTRANMVGYPTVHHQLDLGSVASLLDEWEERVAGIRAGGGTPGPWQYPKLQLLE